MENLLQSGGREVRIRKRQAESKASNGQPETKAENADSIARRAQSLLSSMKEDEVVPSTNPAKPLDIAIPRRYPSSTSEVSTDSEDDESPTVPQPLPKKSLQRQFVSDPNKRSSHVEVPPSTSRPLKSTRRRQPLDLSISQAARTRRRGS